MSSFDLQQHSHRRFNPLTGRWILVSPHRTARPWQGQVEAPAAPSPPQYDPTCYMCPGNRRAQGQLNPHYASTFVFDNDFSALSPATSGEPVVPQGLTIAEGVSGVCRVVCFSPRHDLTLGKMSVGDIASVVDCWVEQLQLLRALPHIHYVQIFENRGQMMGASNSHPHGQIWATSIVPDEIETERTMQRLYVERHGRDLLGDYLAEEERHGERVVAANEHFVALVPFWAVWPFETIVIPRRPAGSLEQLDTPARTALAEILQLVTRTYDRLFETSFPYTMGFHLSPTGNDRGFRLHAHFYPPLLRSASVKKFMVGFELLAMPQRDLTPERAAGLLRDNVQSAIGPV